MKSSGIESEVLQNCSIGAPTSEVIVQFQPGKYLNNQITVCCISCLLIISTVGLNGISVLTILNTPGLKVKVYYFLILVQSCIDLTVGVIGLPLHVYFLITEIVGGASCFTNFLITQILLYPAGLSLTVLSAITLERYYGIVHPILHCTKMTKRRIRLYIFCVGSFVSLCMVLWFVYWSSFFMVVYATIVTLLLFTGYAYTRIFAVARQPLGHPEGNQATPAPEEYQTDLHKKRYLSRELKLAKSCLLVIVCYIICFIPGPLLYLVNPADDTHMIRRIKRSWTVTIIALNSTFNSLLFFWAKPMLRNESIKLMKNCWHRFRNDSTDA